MPHAALCAIPLCAMHSWRGVCVASVLRMRHLLHLSQDVLKLYTSYTFPMMVIHRFLCSQSCWMNSSHVISGMFCSSSHFPVDGIDAVSFRQFLTIAPCSPTQRVTLFMLICSSSGAPYLPWSDVQA